MRRNSWKICWVIKINNIEFQYISSARSYKWTFETPGLMKWIEEHSHGKVLNLFAGKIRLHNLDEFRVDMSGENKPDLVMSAEDALRKFIAEGTFFDTVILDPPYSLRMAREKYEGRFYLGKYTKILNLVPRVLNRNGVVLTFGYKSKDMSKSRGFELRSICLINWGGGHADIVACQEVSIESDYYLNGTGSRWVNGDGVDEFEEDE